MSYKQLIIDTVMEIIASPVIFITLSILIMYAITAIILLIKEDLSPVERRPLILFMTYVPVIGILVVAWLLIK